MTTTKTNDNAALIQKILAAKAPMKVTVGNEKVWVHPSLTCESNGFWVSSFRKHQEACQSGKFVTPESISE